MTIIFNPKLNKWLIFILILITLANFNIAKVRKVNAEESVVLNILVINPSIYTAQTITIKQYLPKEVRVEHIIKVDEGLRIKYDANSDSYFVSGGILLGPGKSHSFTVEIKDVFKISEEEIIDLKKQAETLMAPLRKTSYFAQGAILKSEIDAKLDGILRRQADKPANVQDRISLFRETQKDLDTAKNNIKSLKDLATQASGASGIWGIIGGVQTFATWGLVIGILAGFLLLAAIIFAMWRHQMVLAAAMMEKAGLGPDKEEIPGPKIMDATSSSIDGQDEIFQKIRFWKKIFIFIVILGTIIIFGFLLIKILP
ncbi:MAG TPA: hypothetical protein ENH26_01800 [Candidatus Wolfebacteria bacterium]|nr:hypothetical protein [Candidatus Wolfebacteria bacterium]